MWTNEQPRRSGFYWSMNYLGDIQIVMLDRDGQLWSTAGCDECEVLSVDAGDSYWDVPIWPLLLPGEKPLLRDLFIPKRWVH
jgi:hypothetical protein